MENILYIINEKYDTFSKMHKKLADYILNNSDKAILLSTSELANVSGVSEATIIRFTYKLGFSGYREFQKALLNSIKYTITTLQRFDISKDVSESELIHSQVNSDITDINTTFSKLDPNTILEAAKEIDKSKRVFILGLRTSNLLAQYLAHYLKMMTFQVVSVESTLKEPYEYLINMTEDDILICMSFPRYSQRTLESAKRINKRGFRIISITDSESSPIYKYSKISLIANSSMHTFFDSMVSPLAVINTLILAISSISNRDIKGAFEELEDYWETSETYEKL